MLVLASDAAGVSRISLRPETDEHVPAPDHVVVQIERAALNRVDLLLKSGAIPAPSDPHILGAEGAGVVLRTGGAVSTVSVGDRVAILPYAGCRACNACAEGNPTMCRQARLAGVNASGMYRTKVVVAAADVFPVPGGTTAELSAIVTTLAVAWHVLVCRGGLRAGETVAVAPVASGLGTACGALASALGARVIGVGREASMDSLRSRPSWLAETWAWDASSRITERVHLAVDAAGSTLPFLHERLHTGGRVVSVGGHTSRSIEFDLWRLFTRQQDLRGSHGCHRDDFIRVMEVIAILDHSALIDSVFPVSEFERAYQRLDRAGKLGKVLLDFSETHDED